MVPARKMRVDVSDEEGNRYTITFEGNVTRKKALCMLDIVELLGGVHSKKESKNDTSSVSKFDRAKSVVGRRFPIAWFSSKEVRTAYEEETGEPISLSTISTYLARMAKRGMLLKRGTHHALEYHIMSQPTQNALSLAESR
jgi:hypothetical protein